MFSVWKCTVDTPFGGEEYLMSITADGAIVQHHTGNVSMEMYSYHDNRFFFQKTLDFPIQCRLLIDGKYEDEKITGTIQIDTYLKLSFYGERQ